MTRRARDADGRLDLAVVDEQVFVAGGAVQHRLPFACGGLQFDAVAIRAGQHAAIGVQADVAPGDPDRANRRRRVEPAGERRAWHRPRPAATRCAGRCPPRGGRRGSARSTSRASARRR